MLRHTAAAVFAVIFLFSNTVFAVSTGQQHGYVMPASYQGLQERAPVFQPRYPQYHPMPVPHIPPPPRIPEPRYYQQPMVMQAAPVRTSYIRQRPVYEPLRHQAKAQKPETPEKVVAAQSAKNSNSETKLEHEIKKVLKESRVEQKTTDNAANLSDKKRDFLNKIAPLVHNVNDSVKAERKRLHMMISKLQVGHELAASESGWLKKLGRKYRYKGDLSADALQAELLPKIDEIPVELALAQAANESAWGKSRFAREAQNLFGVWTYDKSKGIVPKKRAKGAKHLVRKYESMEESIRHYITLLNSHPAYKPLRDIRLQLRQQGDDLDGHALAAGLVKYSAKGEKYVRIIRSMIRTNQLASFRQV